MIDGVGAARVRDVFKEAVRRRVDLPLRLEDAVDGADQLDQLVDAAIALGRCDPRVLALPLELVEDRVL